MLPKQLMTFNLSVVFETDFHQLDCIIETLQHIEYQVCNGTASFLSNNEKCACLPLSP